MSVSVLVFAKEPVAGRSKTRLTPPLPSSGAAMLAEAMLADTLAAVARCSAAHRFVVLDGAPGPWLPEGFVVIPQRGDGQAARIAAAFDDAAAAAGGPALLVGMDTPQLTAGLLDRCATRLEHPAVDAVLGPASDGGWWALGLRRPDARALEHVPMGSPQTGERQRARLEALGLRCAVLPLLRDVDTFDDAVAVADAAPGSAFARALGQLRAGVAHRPPTCLVR